MAMMNPTRLTIRQLFTLVLFIGLFLMTLRPIADPDFWWHLRTGQLIVETGAVPHADPFSSTNLGKPWIAHEWLSELFFYGLFRLGGYGLLIFGFSVIISAAFLLAYLRSPEESRPYAAGFVLLLGALSTAPTWGVRPQMISLLLTSLFLTMLDRYNAQKKLRTLLPLPFITALWVNLHAGYLLGIGIIGIYLVGGLIDFLKTLLTRGDAETPSLRPVLTLTGILVACVLAALLNPNGIRILIYPFETLTSSSMQIFIQEWFSPDFHQFYWQPLALFFLALIGAGMLGRKQISLTKILLTLFFAYAALRSMRNVSLFAVAAIPVLADQIGALVSIRSEVRPPARLMRWIVPILLVIAVLVTGARFVQVVQEQSQSEAKTFPRAAVDWLVKNKPGGNLFNSYGWGGYLIWRLYPEYPVYIDGRADVYGDKFIFDYIKTYHAEPGWEQTFAAHNVHLVLVEPGSGIANMLRASPDWQVVFEDSASVLFEDK